MARTVFDIFLSSTSEDLAPYRAKVGEMVARMRQTTIRMETFGAKPKKPLDACRDEVRGCDALIVIVGHRYGWVPTLADGGDGERSITWWEVAWALDAGKPVYAFLVDAGEPWPYPREQDLLLDAATDEDAVRIGRAVRRLHAFRAWLDAHTTREVFGSPDDLGGKVAGSMFDWLLEQNLAALRASPAEAKTAGAVAPAAAVVPPIAPVAAAIAPGAAAAAAPGAAPVVSTGSRLPDVQHLRWQEQLHLSSAQRLAGGAAGVRIALIAGRAETAHPALAGAAVKPFDSRRHARDSPPDDFTTTLAALLVGDDPGSAYRGVAPGADLQVVHVIDDAHHTTGGDVLAALDLAIRGGAQVVCLPLGAVGQGVAERRAYERARRQGVVVVCAAGNAGTDAPVWPAANASCLGAAAVDRDGVLAAFSSFGDWVTTAACGVDVPVAVGSGGYAAWSGTSTACATLAGVVALMLRANARLTPRQVAGIVQGVGAPVLDASRQQRAGSLRQLDAHAAVQAARDAAAPPEATPSRRHRGKP